ncbi:MAG TPA: Hpt domain-containing protein [Variovorax sp.]|jgi:HPt (histidine-containing phosphotransfer) domain-containing protein
MIDLATFAELQDSAGADFVKELVQTFLEEAPLMLQELREALAAGDADAFRRAAHSLKSNSLTFGAPALAAKARQLELGGLAAAQSSGALEALAEEYARVAAALTELSHG